MTAGLMVIRGHHVCSDEPALEERQEESQDRARCKERAGFPHRSGEYSRACKALSERIEKIPGLDPSIRSQRAHPRSRRSELATTSRAAPMSAAMAAQREAAPRIVSATKTAFTESENAMF